MKIVIFGLSISSSWGNGHATLWRGLCSALARRGHQVVFFEKDAPYYAAHRDLWELPAGRLELYQSWADVQSVARRQTGDADVAIVTSFCPDALAATELIATHGRALRVFYDLDAPVTLAALAEGQPVDYIGPRGLRDFDLVLSYAGGPALDALRTQLQAAKVAPLYGSVDPSVHHPASPSERYKGVISYLGTHSPDRVQGLHDLFVEPARALPHERFVIGGSKYDGHFPWLENIFYVSHVPSSQHAEFYTSARYTLNVTRVAMAQNGYCPSGRLFEAAACGAAILTDGWPGIEQFFEPGWEIEVARNSSDVLRALDRSDAEIAGMRKAARERALACHTAAVRASELEALLEAAASPAARGA